MANMRHCVKFCADQSNRCRDITIFRFFKMAAVYHLGFLSLKFYLPGRAEGQFAKFLLMVEPLWRYGHFSIF